MVNLTTLAEELSTSLKENDNKITKLMNKLESIKGGQTLTTKALQKYYLDIVEDPTIRAIRNMCCITNNI